MICNTYRNSTEAAWRKTKSEGHAVRHKNGSVGKVKRVTNTWSDNKVYILWDGWKPYKSSNPVEYSYRHNSPCLDVIDCKYEDYIAQGGAQEMTNALYEVTINGETKFATKVAEKSKTVWIVEIKGTEDYVAIPVTDLKEVLPYTIRVRYLGDGSVNDVEAEEGKFAVGEIYLTADQKIAFVCALNTGKKGCPDFKPVAKFNLTAV